MRAINHLTGKTFAIADLLAENGERLSLIEKHLHELDEKRPIHLVWEEQKKLFPEGSDEQKLLREVLKTETVWEIVERMQAENFQPEKMDPALRLYNKLKLEDQLLFENLAPKDKEDFLEGLEKVQDFLDKAEKARKADVLVRHNLEVELKGLQKYTHLLRNLEEASVKEIVPQRGEDLIGALKRTAKEHLSVIGKAKKQTVFAPGV